MTDYETMKTKAYEIANQIASCARSTNAETYVAVSSDCEQVYTGNKQELQIDNIDYAFLFLITPDHAVHYIVKGNYIPVPKLSCIDDLVSAERTDAVDPKETARTFAESVYNNFAGDYRTIRTYISIPVKDGIVHYGKSIHELATDMFGSWATNVDDCPDTFLFHASEDGIEDLTDGELHEFILERNTIFAANRHKEDLVDKMHTIERKFGVGVPIEEHWVGADEDECWDCSSPDCKNCDNGRLGEHEEDTFTTVMTLMLQDRNLIYRILSNIDDIFEYWKVHDKYYCEKEFSWDNKPRVKVVSPPQ